MPAFRVGLTLLLALAACRGQSPRDVATLEQHELDSMVTALMPKVAEASGLEFKATPRVAVRDRDQVRSFLLNKLAEELPPERLDGIVTTYRLLGLLPDTLDVRALFVDLYTEQVAGFYEPDSSTLYAVAGADGVTLQATLIHELVHALQHQYVALDSILEDTSDADRLAAAQAILEGQATLVMLLALAPDPAIINDEATWAQLRGTLSSPQEGLEVFNNAPLVIRSGLIFPYLEGAEFMRWFVNNHPADQPYGSRMPRSTEHILHPERYQAGDAPLRLAFDGDTTGMLHEDTFGEYEMRVLRAQLAGISAVAVDEPLGWEGDRFRVFRSVNGPALVWYSAWERDADRDNFTQRVVNGLRRLERPGYRTVIDAVPIGAVPGARVVIAPVEWEGWSAMPAVTPASSEQRAANSGL